MTGAVAIVIESLGGGGAQHVATTLANAWAAQGRQINVITFRDRDSDAFALDPRVCRVVIGGAADSPNPAAAMAANLRRILRLRSTLRQSDAQTVLSFVCSTNVLTVLASWGLRRRVVVSERNDPARQPLPIMWKLMRHLFYRHADLVIANSRAAIDAMSRYVPAAHMTWLPNPLRTAPGSDGVRYDGPFFLAVGRLTGQKAYDVLIAAFAEIGKLLPGWRLVILGDGPLRDDLTRLSAALGVSERVQFAGHVGDPFAWYRAAKVFVHAARYEGLPNAVLEAMSEALPVVVTDGQPGLRDFVRDGESGIVVGVDSVPALADAMKRLAKDEGLRRRLGGAARDAVAPCRTDRAVAAWSAALALP